jgi:glycosyltransferase involved in cell wall biosynthesis
LAAAIRRSIGFVQTRVPSLTRSKVLPYEIQERMPTPPAEQLLIGSHQAKPCQGAAPVLMLVDSFHDGGVERVVIDLCLQLRNSGRPCKVLVAKDGGRSAKEARSHGIEVIEFHQSHRSLEHFLLATSEGIVLTHHCYFALKKFHEAGIPIVEVIHNAYHWQKGNQEIAKYRHDFISSFVSVSEFVRNFSINELGIDSHKVVLINNGLSNVDLIRPPLEILREKRLQTAGEPILLHVANLHPQKNHRLVVNAFAHVKSAYPKARLIMAGAMDGYPELAKALFSDIESLGVSDSVQLAGALDRRELSKTMAAAHIGLLPSVLEGFSIATLEFTFFGLPSVLSATGAADELKTSFGHIEIAEGCALPQCKLSVNAIESLLKDFPDDAVLSLSNAILKILESYPAYLEKSLLAGASFSGYAIEHAAAQYEQLLTTLESGKVHDEFTS